MRRTAAALAALALVAGLGACTHDEGAADPTTTTTAAATTTTTAPPAALPEVLDPGVEPRRALRLAYREGDEVTLRLATDLVVDQTSDGRAQRLDSPPIATIVHLTVGTTTPEGAEVALAIESATVAGEGTDLSEEQLAAYQRSIDPLAQVTGTISYDPYGRAVASDLDLPDGLPDATRTALRSLEAQLSQLGPPLPEAAVGVGARWRAELPLPDLGTAIEGTAEQVITVTAIDGDRITYEAETTTQADPQDLDLGEGDSARLTALTSTGTVRGWFETTSPAQQVESTLTSTVSLELVDEDGVPQLDQRIATVVRITPQP